MSDKILRVENLVKHFPIKGGILGKTVGAVRAVDGVSFYIRRGETLGLVGESGCGKTTIGLAILALEKPTQGKVYFEDKNMFELKRRELQKLRKNIQMIFQDPFLSLNPRMTVHHVLGEAHDVRGESSGAQKEREIMELIDKVGLAKIHLPRYPHEFSGGQKQRIAIARALAVKPQLIVADEPVSSLDVSVRSKILNLIRKLKKELQLSYLYISHDLSTVAYICDRVAVMYLGKLVEITNTRDFFENPLHPYSKALLSAVPIPDPTVKRSSIMLEGEIPTPVNPPSGCRFHTRCPYAKPICKETEPKLINVGTKTEHFVACHLVTPATL